MSHLALRHGRCPVPSDYSFRFFLSNCREEKITTPFGDPVDSYMIGQLEIGDGKVLEGCELVFLPRHGRGKEGGGGR